jgi:hypothetical protein
VKIDKTTRRVFSALALVNFRSDEQMMLELIQGWVRSEKDFCGEDAWIALDSYVKARLEEEYGKNQINKA